MSLKLTVAANFSAEGLRPMLLSCLEMFGERAELAFVPSGQLIQFLLSETVTADYLLVLLQLERWLGNDPGSSEASTSANIEDLAQAIAAARGHSDARQFLVVLCAPSPGWLGSTLLGAAESQLKDFLAGSAGIEIVTMLDGLRQSGEEYEVSFDPFTEQLAQIPYTPLGFAALALTVGRRLYGLTQTPRKVIVSDCDQTLWEGMCGEVGPLEVRVDEEHRLLQSRLLEQVRGGRLLCLCSKNDEKSVMDVLDQHPDMLIRRTDLVSWRVNWTPKPENLKSLSLELGLPLDAFVFIDDDAFECNYMEETYPGVLTLQIPASDREAFLDGIWDLELSNLTDEDRNRTRYYHQDVVRSFHQKASISLACFIASLNLKVRILPLTAVEVLRIEQLSVRTNQFNLNGVRLSAVELLRAAGRGDAWFLEVSDRFGDYGIVGAIVTESIGTALSVQSLFLSCRALGRGVEAHLRDFLTQLAAERAARLIRYQYVDTGRNNPLSQFLKESGAMERDGTWDLSL